MASICSSVPATQRHKTLSSRLFTTLLRLGVTGGVCVDAWSSATTARSSFLSPTYAPGGR